LEPGIGAVSSISSRSNGKARSLAPAGQIELETRAQTRQPAKRRRRLAIVIFEKNVLREEDGHSAVWDNGRTPAARVKSISGYPQFIIRALSKSNGAAGGGPMQNVTYS
jgi:hypothetical protein